MKVKKLGALILSVAMVFTSFSVPVFAEEIVDEQIAEIVEEASEEIVEESVTEEVTSADAEIVEALDEEVITGKKTEPTGENVEGNSYIVGSNEDFVKYLKSVIEKGKETNKYVLAAGNKGKMVTLVLATDVTVDAEDFAVPSDRYLHIDLNGYDLKPTVSDNKIILERTGDKEANYKWPSLVVENSGAATADFGFEVKVEGNADVNAEKKALLEIGEGVGTTALLTNSNGIIKIDAGAVVEGGIDSDAGKFNTTNIQGTVASSVSGNGISLANAKISAGGSVVSTGDLYVSGKTTGNIAIATGDATIAGDADTTRDNAIGTITIGDNATVIMQSGFVSKLNMTGNNSTFTMYGGRIENRDNTAITVGGTGNKVILEGGVVAAPSANAITPGTWYDIAGHETTDDATKYIVNGEAADSDMAAEGTIADSYDLVNALKFGGNYVLTKDVPAGGLSEAECTVTATKPIKITNKANYKIDLGSNTLKLNGRNLTIGVNIESNSTVIDASAEGSKLTVIGGSINNTLDETISGNAILVNSINDVTADPSENKNIKLVGGIVAGSAGYADGTLKDVVAYYDNCAVADKTAKGYANSASVLVGGKPVIKAEIEVTIPYVVLAEKIAGYDKIALQNVFGCSLLGIEPTPDDFTYSVINEKVAKIEKEDLGEGEEDVLKPGDKDGITRVKVTAKIDGEIIAEDYAIVENANDIEEFAGNYNATLIYGSGTVNAYKKNTKVYFDFHLNSSSDEAMTGAAANSIKPYKAAVNVPAKNKFSYYFTPNADGTENKSLLYDVKYDDDKNLYYIDLYTVKAVGDAMESTRLVDDGVEEITGLKFNIQFGVSANPSSPLFTVPITKYSYNPLNSKGDDITNPEVAYTIKVKNEEPELEFEKTIDLSINTNYTIDGHYWLSYPNLANADSNYVYVTPGYINGSDIYEASNKNIELTGVEVIKPGDFNSTGTFNGNDLKIFYKGSAADSENKEGEKEEKPKKEDKAKNKSSKLNVLVNYEGYWGTFELTVPVTIKSDKPEPTLTKGSFTVEKNKAVSNIPLSFKAEDPDSVGAITGIEVVSGRKYFTVQNSEEDVTTTDEETYVKSGYSLAVAPIDGDKATIAKTAKIKVTFDNIKPNKGTDFVKYYNVKVTAVDPAKYTVTAKSTDVLNLKTENESVAEYELITNPAYMDKVNDVVDISVVGYKKGVSGTFTDGLSVTKVVDGKFSVIKEAGEDLSTYKKVELQIKYHTTKDVTKKVTVKTNAKLPNITKTSGKVTMDLAAESVKKFANGKVKADNTAAKMAKAFNYGGTNVRFATISGNDADLFEVKETSKGKTIKITPNLAALKAGKIQPGKTYTFDVKYYEDGTNEYLEKETEMTVEIAKAEKKNKPVVSIKTGTARFYNKSPQNGATFTIQTKKPYYGMQIKSVKIAAADKNGGIFEIENLNVNPGFTALRNGEGYENSDFRIVFKDGKVPTETKKGKTTQISGKRTVKLEVEYENGIKANVNLSTYIYAR